MSRTDFDLSILSGQRSRSRGGGIRNTLIILRDLQLYFNELARDVPKDSSGSMEGGEQGVS